MKVIKTDTPGYDKDMDYGWVINTNNDELRAYQQQKERSKEIRALQRNHDNLHKDVMELKAMLKEIIEKIGK